jgi:predicted ArsR family transcriptional regulator
MPDEPSVLRLDAEAVKVLAHPLRSRLLTRLRRDGPATATELAGALATNTGATSYHLRRLASVGLVADTGTGEGRRRVWRAATDAHRFEPSDVADDADAEAALGWLVRHYARGFTEHLARWLDAEPAWPRGWRDALGASDAGALVTQDQARALAADVEQVVARYRSAGAGHPDALRVAVYTALLPVDTDPDGADQGSREPREPARREPDPRTADADVPATGDAP